MGELRTLRQHADNPTAAGLFGDIGRAANKEAMAVVRRIADAAIRNVVAGHGGSGLAAEMMARRAAMA